MTIDAASIGLYFLGAISLLGFGIRDGKDIKIEHWVCYSGGLIFLVLAGAMFAGLRFTG